MSIIDVKPEGYNAGFEKGHHGSLPEQERTQAYLLIDIPKSKQESEPEALKKLTKNKR